MQPIVKLVYDNQNCNFVLPKEVLPEGRDKSFDHQFLGTNIENLCELSGRLCYDSVNQEKTRNTHDYFNHILEVNHTSILEHVNLTFEVIGKDYYGLSCLNRPGVNCKLVWNEGKDCFMWRITANLRSILEWKKHNNSYSNILWENIEHKAKQLAPIIFKNSKVKLDYYPCVEIVRPKDEDEIWISFFISGVSRALSHELIRHKYGTAVSQRSTRYVDESESQWVWHPLIIKYLTEDLDTRQCDFLGCKYNCQHVYKDCVNSIVEKLINVGVDKFTARKQARGAARGILGNALSTEMIFSASLKQWSHIILMRANEGADGEIRILLNKVYNILRERFPKHFVGFSTKQCKDGIGFQVNNK